LRSGRTAPNESRESNVEDALFRGEGRRGRRGRAAWRLIDLVVRRSAGDPS